MYNRVILMGRICNDLELKTTPSGVSVLSFSVAVDRRYQADKENKITDFFNVVAWRMEADFIARFFAKGRMILLEGELQNRKYTDKAGAEHWITEIIADRATFTGEKTAREAPPLPDEPPQYKKQESAADTNAGHSDTGTPPEQLTAEALAAAAEDYPF